MIPQDPHGFSPSIQKIFQKLVGSSDPLEQIQAAYKLSQSDNKEEALEALKRGLILEDPDLKLAILDIFLQPEFLDGEIIEPLKNLLKDNSSEVRMQAAEMLGTLKDEVAIDSLVANLNDEDPQVRYTIMAALASIGNPSIAKDIEPFLQSKIWQDRFNAVDAIGMLANLDSIHVLIGALNDPHPNVRENAAIHVGHFNFSPIQETLLILLDDDVLAVQAAATYTLGEFAYKDACLPLLDFLKSDSHDLILVTIEALSKIQDERSIPGLVEMLYHNTKAISLAAQEALDVFPNMSLLEPLINALKEDVILRYIEHRLKIYPEEKNGQKRTKTLLMKHQVPMWLEMLLYEVLI
jgi:HEAT repeat protein